jgi:hypothetical protein
MPEGLKRLVAVFVAVVLVVAALIWRKSRNDNDKSATTPTTTSSPANIICVTELDSVCKTVFGEGKFTLEPAGTTTHNLETAATAPDLWLTMDPWPTVVAQRRVRAAASPLDVTTKALASTFVDVVGPADRLKVLAANCPGKLWSCIGDLSGKEWSAIGGPATWRLIRPAYFRPDESASGYAVFANAIVSKLAKTTFSNIDLDGITAWGRNLESGVPTIAPTVDPTPLEQLRLGVLQYDVVGVLDTEIPRPLKDGLDVIATGTAVVNAIAVTRPGFSLPSTITAELTKAGWLLPTPLGIGLPDSNLVDAVLAFWKDVKGP